MSNLRLLDRVRDTATRWRTAAAIAGNVALCEIGARIGLPGVDGGRVQEFFHKTHLGLLAVYDGAAGGAVSRGAVLALGAIPYLQAEAYLWLARLAIPQVKRATEESAVRRSVMRVTTVGLALVQGFGFATFLERIPGAVVTPGTGFVGQTTLLITGGAVLVGWLGEVIAESARGDVAEVQLLPLSEAGAALPHLPADQYLAFVRRRLQRPRSTLSARL